MPRAKRPGVPRAVREPGLIAELRSAISDADASNYRIAQKAGIDETALRKFVTRERSLSLLSGALLAEALGMRIVRPSRPRKFAGHPRGGVAPAAGAAEAGPENSGEVSDG